jgi:predicted RecA/RadA family phage recombinase/lysophospholipase L1-like esterase
MKNYVMDGEVVTMAAPYDLANGEAVQVGSVFGVSAKAAKLGEAVDLATVGVFDLVAESTQSYLPGTELFWDVANKRITSVSGVGSCVGVCMAPKAAGVAVVRVRLAPVFKGLTSDPASLGAVRGAALAARLWQPRNMVVTGDSFAAGCHRLMAPTSITVSNGVATVAQNAHGLYTGAKVSLSAADILSANVHQAAVTVIDANTYTFPVPGVPNGALAAYQGLSIRLVDLSRQSDGGVSAHLIRRVSGAYRLVSNAGASGHKAAQWLRYWDQRVAAFEPDVIVRVGAYNDINGGVSVDEMISAARDEIEAAGALGAMILVSNCWPWGATAAANTSANRIRAVEYNRKLAMMVDEYSHARYIDMYAATVDGATGLARVGMLGSDDVHPSWRGSDVFAKLCAVAIGSHGYTARPLVASAVDSIAVDSASKQICRIGPWATTTGGSLGSGVTAAVPADAATSTAVAGVAAGLTVTGNSITAQAWIDVAQDGNGYAQYARYTADANLDQARVTYQPTLTDLTPGDVIDCVVMVDVTTAHNASNKTLAGQNLTALTAQLVVIIDGQTYIIYEAAATGTAAALDDIKALPFVIDGAVIPAGVSMTTVRLDIIANFGGAGSVQLAVSHFEMRKR